MPFNLPVTKNGLQRPPRFSLSLRSNARRLNEEEIVVGAPRDSNIVEPKTEPKPKPNKRPAQNTPLERVSAAKRVKTQDPINKPNTRSVTQKDTTLTDKTTVKVIANTHSATVQVNQTSSKSPSSDFDSGRKLLIVLNPLSRPLVSAMLNGHHHNENQYGGGPPKKNPITALTNLGNTCFLNSVLYVLRYAPRFIHNLHHLVSDLTSVEQKLGSIRLKSSSLGRSAAGLTSSGGRSWSSKDLLSLGQSDNSSGKSKRQVATEKLHETYVCMRTAETKCIHSNSSDGTPEPYAADPFLAALRDINSTFEGHRQQDAHEFLVCLLDNIRETCRALSARAARLQIHENGDSNGIGRQPSLDGDGGKPTLGNLRKSWKKRRDVRANDKRNSPTEERAPSPADQDRDERTRPGWDFVAEDFEGTMVVRTMCLECETVTEKRQAVCELCVPVGDEDASDDEPFRDACLTSEYLRDQNKYWCERCMRYNEARRTVAYSRLPRLLVLQLKRFSGGMEKINKYAPTPLLMSCFCEVCTKRSPEQPLQHRYILYGVIMHLGQTLGGGHYVAYARDVVQGEARCERERDREGAGDAAGGGTSGSASVSASFMRSLFSRPRPAPAGCTARDCCVPRPRSDAGWFACDDEIVKPLSNQEFADLLSPERNRADSTPYLLFYVKTDVD